LYLAVVVDACSRKVVGWEMAGHLRTELVLEALDMAAEQRSPEGTVHHSDQGCQYTAVGFGKRCEKAGVRPSMGSVGDCYDNAMCESFFATLECELLHKARRFCYCNENISQGEDSPTTTFATWQPVHCRMVVFSCNNGCVCTRQSSRPELDKPLCHFATVDHRRPARLARRSSWSVLPNLSLRVKYIRLISLRSTRRVRVCPG